MNITEKPHEERDALDECWYFLHWLRQGARVQKRRAYLAVGILPVASALIPVAILVSTRYSRFYFGQLLPSLLAAAAAVGAAWISVARPIDRWMMYRRFERAMEFERLKYVHHIDEYADPATADRILIRRIGELKLTTQEASAALMPSVAELISSIGRHPRQ
jgi:hypothetical protein